MLSKQIFALIFKVVTFRKVVAGATAEIRKKCGAEAPQHWAAGSGSRTELTMGSFFCRILLGSQLEGGLQDPATGPAVSRSS